MDFRLRFLKNKKIVLLIIIAVFSMAILCPVFTNPQTLSGTLNVIKENKTQAMLLTTTVTLASTIVSAIPDDTATPLAEELSDLSTPLLLIVCILYFEQFMLSCLEGLSFGMLVPCACFLFILFEKTHRKSFYIIGVKLSLIAIVCMFIIPLSAQITKMIESVFSYSIDTTFEKVKSLSNLFSEVDSSGKGNDLLEFFSKLGTGISTIADVAMDMLAIMVDAVAILLITCCAIPVITALLFLWSIKSILNGKMENLQDTAMEILRKAASEERNIAA